MHQSFDTPIKGEFRVIECRGRDRLIECLRCGYEFITDNEGMRNAVFDWEKMAHVPACPLCSTEGS